MENRIAAMAGVILAAMLFVASCRTTALSDRDDVSAIDELLQTRLPWIEVTGGGAYDIVMSLQRMVAERHGGRTFFWMYGSSLVESNVVSGVATATYKASNVTVSVALREMMRQMGLTTGLVHGAVVIGTPRSVSALDGFPSLPQPASRRLAGLLDKRWEGEWGVCQSHVVDVLDLITRETRVPTDLGYTTDWPVLFVRQTYCNLRIRDILWWTGATSGKEVVLVDDGVSFKEREGVVVTNAWFVPPAEDISEIALAVSVWPRARQYRSGGGWLTQSTFTNKTVYCLDLGFRPEQAQIKAEKAFAKGLARLGWLPQTGSVKLPGVRSNQTYGKGSRRLDVWMSYAGGALTLAYWQEGH
jgi:hypothetical protein